MLFGRKYIRFTTNGKDTSATPAEYFIIARHCPAGLGGPFESLWIVFDGVIAGAGG